MTGKPDTTASEVRWTEHMPEADSVRSYVIQVDDARINRAVKMLAKAGVTLVPHRDIIFPEDRQPATGAQAATVAREMNRYLQANGLSPELKDDTGSRTDGLALEEVTEVWELAELFEWRGLQLQGPSGDPISQDDWDQEAAERAWLALKPRAGSNPAPSE